MSGRSARIAVISALILLFLAVSTSAQEIATHPGVLTNPQVNTVIKFDVSPPLRGIATQLPLQMGLHEASPARIPHLQQLMAAAQGGEPAKDGALQATVGSPVSATVGLNLLGVGNGFPGYSVPDAPSDVNLAVGDTQVVQWVNVSYAVFNKTTGAIIQGPILGNAFWSGFGGGCQNTNSGDIIIQWDKVAHRWLAAQNVFSSPYLTCIAVSTTPDATGTYYRYVYSQPGFPDYPKWSIWPDAYYQSQNNFGSSGSSFMGAYVCAYNRAKMLVGDSTAEQVCFQNGTFDNSLLPADLDSANTAPPSGEQEVFLGSVDEGNVYEYLFHVNFASPSSSTFTGANGTMPISGVASYSLACGGFGACIPQEGISDQLDSLGDRLMYRVAYRNFSDHQAWLVSHAVTAGSSVGERWYEFRAPETSTSLSVYQQGTFAPDSNYRWMGSLAMDQVQDIALGYSVSSSSMYPSISYTGRVATDTLGTMESEASIISGSGSQSDTSNRWGDYTSMAIDATDDCTFWYTNQYYTVTATFDWSTRLASLKFPNCGSASSFSLSASPTALSIAPGNQGTSTITSTISSGYNNSIRLSASGAPSGMTVSFSPTTIPAPGSGTSTMTVTVASNTAQGTYPITVTGSDGTNQESTTVTVTVTGPPTFTMSASPTTLTVVQGNQGTSTLTTTIQNGFNSSISLSASGIVAGVTVTLNPSVIAAPGNGTSTVTFAVSSSASQGTYPITFTGTGGGVQQNTTITLTVAPPPSFTLHAQPPALTINQGSQGSVTINSSITSGFNSSVSLSTSGLPTGVTASFSLNPIPAPGSGNSTLTFTVASSTATGTYTITVTGTGGGTQSTATVSLTVAAGPHFTISASPSSLTVGQGGQGTTTITSIISGGFNNPIGLSASGVPNGVNVNLQPNNLQAPGSGNSTMSIQVNNNVAAGTYPITVTGNGGGIQQSTTVTLTVTVPNFTISASPSSLTVGQGGQGTTTITSVISGGFNNQVQLQANGLPGGVNASFNPNNIPAPGSGSSTMTITVNSNTTSGTYPVTVTAQGGNIHQTITIMLTVATPNFSISASPSSLSVAPGNQGTTTVTTAASGGFNSSISLSASGMPTGVSAAFNPTSIPAPGNGSSTLTFTVASNATPGTYPITVTANGGGLQHSTTVSLTVTAPPNFTITATPSVLTVVQGNQGTSTLTTTAVNGFNNPISLSASGVPAGVTVTLNPSVIAAPGNGSSTVTFAVNSSASQGAYPITFTGSGGGVQQSTTITLTVAPPPSFSIHGQPPALSVAQGSQGSVTITSSITGGFNNPVSLSASGLPTGVTASFSVNPVPAPGSGNSTLTFTVASTTATGTYTITVTGSGGGVQSTASVSLTVVAPTFTISASPSSLSVNQGQQGTSTISITAGSGFNSSISLSASGLPSGVTASFSTNPIPAPGSGSSTLTLSVASTTASGTYPITVMGSGSGVQQNTTVTLTVTSGPNFTVTASPSSVSIGQGYQGTTTITTAVSGGFNSQISLSASGVPSGVNVNLNPNNISAPGSGSSTMSIQVNSNVAAGTYPITVTGSGGGLQRTATVTLTVTVPSFSVSASPSSLTVSQGSQGTTTVTTAISGGFNSQVQLQVNGLPGGVNVSFNPNNLPAPGSGMSTMTITVNSNTTAGTYPITVTASGGNMQQTTTVMLTVQAVDFTLTATPSSQIVNRGQQATYTVTLTPINGFNGNVSLQQNGCPPSSNCSFSPQSVTPPGSSTFTVSTQSGTQPGTYTLTITGKSGNLQHIANVSLTAQ